MLSTEPSLISPRGCVLEKIMEKVKLAFFLRNAHAVFHSGIFLRGFCHGAGYELYQAMRDMAPPTRPKEFLKTFNSETI